MDEDAHKAPARYRHLGARFRSNSARNHLGLWRKMMPNTDKKNWWLTASTGEEAAQVAEAAVSLFAEARHLWLEWR